MERRAFIRKSGLLGLAVGLGPQLIRASNSLPVPALGEPTSHIRHGLFQSARLNHPFLPSWIQVFQPHRFMKDGVLESSEDMKLFSFRCQEDWISVGLFDDAVHVSINDRTFVCEKMNEPFTLEESGYNIRLLQSGQSIALASDEEALFVALSGEATANGHLIEAHGFYHHSETETALTLRDEAKGIVIQRIV